jgi:phosphoribosylformylglycinamidine synthase I
MKSAVIVFPGSNCDRDVFTVMQGTGLNPARVWHKETALPAGIDLVVLPGGFSYGDYLRCGAIAAQSPIMQAVKAHAARGGYVLGICNGFQVLCESGLLPGTLMRNRDLRFQCKEVFLRVETDAPIFLKNYQPSEVVNFPIAHAEGNYAADDATLAALEDRGQVALRYVNRDGVADAQSNPNGSSHDIAGVLNAAKNVLGLMPHPERHSDPLTGGTDGLRLFQAFA